MAAPFPADARGVSFRIVIFLACVAMICGCSGAVAVATYAANSRVILRVAEQAFERSGAETIDDTDDLLKPVAAAVAAASTAVEEDATSIAKPNMPRFLYDVVALYPQVYSAYAAAPDGRFVQVQRLSPGAKLSNSGSVAVPPGTRFALRTVAGEGRERTDSYRFIARWGEVVGSRTVEGSTYDPRGRPFYADAAASAAGVLTDIYTFASNGKPGITFARRIVKDGALLGVVAADITLDRLSEFLAAQPVGEHGIAMIVDAAGHVVAAPTDRGGAGAAVRTVRDVGGPPAERAWLRSTASPTTFTFASGGQDYLAAVRHFPAAFDKSWTIMEVAPVDDFVGELKATFRTIALCSLAVAVLAGLGSLVVAGQITRPIASLTAEADRIRSLRLDEPVAGRSRIREIQHLIDGMGAMKAALHSLAGDEAGQAAALEGLGRAGRHSKLFQRVSDHLERRRARETELSLAADIQRSVLPRSEDEVTRSGDGALRPATISARMRPAREVGGDFYDWFWRDDGRLVFVIGDVSGKGIPAALLMTSTRTAIRSMIMAGASLTGAVASANRLLSENNERCFFVTLLIAELDPGTGRLTYINAGHEPARVLSAGNGAGLLGPGGPALGVIDDAAFEAGTARLRPGDTVVAYTDGVVDAFDRSGESFGEARVEAVLRAGSTAAAPDVVDRVFAAVDRFAGDELQFDDITCVVLHYAAEAEAA